MFLAQGTANEKALGQEWWSTGKDLVCGGHAGKKCDLKVRSPFCFFLLQFCSLLIHLSFTSVMVWFHLSASEMKSLMLTVLSDVKASFLFGSFSPSTIYEFLGKDMRVLIFFWYDHIMLISLLSQSMRT